MQLTQHTDLGIRLMIVLARKGAGPLSLPAFAAQQRLSYHHVAKVAQALVHEGLLVSRRGRSGGVELAGPAAGITIGGIVRALEKGLRLADCANCALKDGCGVTGLLDEALAAFLDVLDRKTLSDAALPQRGLQSVSESVEARSKGTNPA